ncbi:MAG: hypothetical protein ABL986_02610 [Vicinamibacterales bacterium]
MSRWTAQTWREWFFEVFAQQGRMPFRPLPTTEAERREREEAAERARPRDITRLNLDDDGESSSPSRSVTER